MLNVTVKPFEKTLSNVPLVGVVATISTPTPTNPKAQIVLVGLQATLAAGAAAEKANVLIRDGATGVGAILKRVPLAAVISGSDRLTLSNITLPMTPGNVCTVEFEAAPSGTGFEAVALDYYSTDALSNSAQYGANG